jgi:hypothetical protein
MSKVKEFGSEVVRIDMLVFAEKSRSNNGKFI